MTPEGPRRVDTEAPLPEVATPRPDRATAVTRVAATVAVVRGQRRRVHSDVRRVVLIVAGLRVGLGLTAWLSLRLAPPTFENGDWLRLRLPPASALAPMVAPWQRWDALWYQHLATSGYRHDSIDAAFFPFYPALMRGLGLVLGHRFALAGLLISTLAFGGALILLQRLVSDDLDRITARRTVLYLSLAPTAFYFLAPYTEAVFLLLSVAAFLGARRRRWVLAGVCSGLAALTRPTGVLLAAPLLLEAITQTIRRRRSGAPPSRAAFLAAVAPVGATLAYFVYAVKRLETPGGPLRAEHAWKARVVPPWRALSDSLGAIVRFERPEEVVNFLAALLLLAALPLMVSRLPSSYTAYAAVMALPICSREAYASPLMSSARFAVVVFPLFVVLAQAGRNPRVDRLVKCLFPALMLPLFIGFVHYRFAG